MSAIALPPFPPANDLRRLVHFSANDGRIWLAGQRMLLFHAAALGGLRREMIRTVGVDAARRVLLRAGYAAGEKDSFLARQVRPQASMFEAFSVGPQLHMLEGAVQVSAEHFELDMTEPHYLGVYRWDNSWEVETFLRDFGPQVSPVCWMLVGYASGYTSGFFGRRVLYKEVKCAGCGCDHCIVEGRFQEEWPDGDLMARDYDATSVSVRMDDLRSQVEALRTQLVTADESGPLVGRSRSFSEAVQLLHKAAPTRVSVLFTGETGVGKERFARALHLHSPRAKKPFVAVNCAALPAELIESELFGAEKGAYTGAGGARPGRFERADGGTLLLDELGELPLPAQAKLLRVLQSGEVERLGGTTLRKVDVRLVAATNVDLEVAVAEGRFRRDLYYRVNVYPIRIPPLRERLEDIEPLADHLLKRFTALHGSGVTHFTDRGLDAMRSYDWPGNVRELENRIERAVILSSAHEPIDVKTLFPSLPEPLVDTLDATGHLENDPAGRFAGFAELYDDIRRRGMSLDSLEDALINEAVRRECGNLAAAARSLGITGPQLRYRLSRQRQPEPS